MPLDNEAAKSGRIEPEALNETNMLELYVFASDEYRQAVFVARLDNLGRRFRRGGAEHAAYAGLCRRVGRQLGRKRGDGRVKPVKPGHDGVLLKTP